MPSAAPRAINASTTPVSAWTKLWATLNVTASLAIVSWGRSVHGTLTSTDVSYSCTSEAELSAIAGLAPSRRVTIGRRLSTRVWLPPILAVTYHDHRTVSVV